MKGEPIEWLSERVRLSQIRPRGIVPGIGLVSVDEDVHVFYGFVLSVNDAETLAADLIRAAKQARDLDADASDDEKLSKAHKRN